MGETRTSRVRGRDVLHSLDDNQNGGIIPVVSQQLYKDLENMKNQLQSRQESEAAKTQFSLNKDLAHLKSQMESIESQSMNRDLEKLKAQMAQHFSTEQGNNNQVSPKIRYSFQNLSAEWRAVNVKLLTDKFSGKAANLGA